VSLGRALRAVPIVIALALWADSALACSVCVGAQTPDTRNAWIAMTAFMTFTPLSIVVGVGLWLRQRFRALEASEREAALVGRTHDDGSDRGPSAA
jgi:hypothetical protein